MRKKLLAVMTAMVVTGSMIGCGANKEQDWQNEINSAIGDDEEFQDFINEVDDYFNDSSDISAGMDMVESGSENTEYEHFDLLAEWSDHRVDEYKIQIDDTIYYMGLTVQEFIDKVEASSVDYTYEYNPDSLVTEEGYFDVYRDGVRWMTVFYYNYTGDVCSLSKARVTHVDCSKESQPYTYILDGITYDDLCSKTYDEVQEYIAELFPEYTISITKGWGSEPNRINCQGKRIVDDPIWEDTDIYGLYMHQLIQIKVSKETSLAIGCSETIPYWGTY